MSEKSENKSNAIVHAAWVIGLLIFIICALLINRPSGEIIRDYISFASSVASLLLAVIAIFYSMISSQTLAASTGSLQNSVQSSQAVAGELSQTSLRLADRTDEIIEKLSTISPKMNEISEKLDTRFSPFGASTPDRTEDAKIPELESSSLFVGRATSGTTLTLYLISLAFQNSKPIKLKSVFESKKWQDFSGGVIAAVMALRSHDIIIDFTRDPEDSQPIFEVKSIGALDIDKLKALVDKSKVISTVKMKTVIENYFYESVSSDSSNDDE